MEFFSCWQNFISRDIEKHMFLLNPFLCLDFLCVRKQVFLFNLISLDAISYIITVLKHLAVWREFTSLLYESSGVLYDSTVQQGIYCEKIGTVSLWLSTWTCAPITTKGRGFVPLWTISHPDSHQSRVPLELLSLWSLDPNTRLAERRS